MKRLPSSLSLEAIVRTWKDSPDGRRRSGASGVDNVSPTDFQSDLEQNIRRARWELQRGDFRFESLRIALIPKDAGGHRVIAVPTVRDRLIQRALLRHLEQDPRFRANSSISYGFTRGRTLVEAQRKALELRNLRPFVAKADIVKFFDQIRRDDVKQKIRQSVRSKNISELLCNAVDCELDNKVSFASRHARDNGIRAGIGLRQGMPVSPMLSNLLLRDLDVAIERSGISAIRYADDIAIFGRDHTECAEALSLISRHLKKIGLRIPELAENSKTVVYAPSEELRFLGIGIRRHGAKYKISPPNWKLEKIEAELQKLCSIEKCFSDRRTLLQTLKTSDSFVIGHEAALSAVDDKDHFMARLRAIRDREIRKLLASVIGKAALRNMSSAQLSVLGVEPFAG